VQFLELHNETNCQIAKYLVAKKINAFGYTQDCPAYIPKWLYAVLHITKNVW